MKPDDKPKQTDGEYENPKLYIVIDDKKIPRPGLETAFVDYLEGGDNATTNPATDSTTDKSGSKTVGGSVCTCNKVRVATCGCVGHTSCGCVGHTTCSCVSHRPCSCDNHSSGGYSAGGCRCAPVH